MNLSCQVFRVLKIIVSLLSTARAVFVLGQEAVPCSDVAILPDIELATNVAQADSDWYNPGRPAIGSDGTNYLIVSQRSLGSPEGLFGALVSGKGTVVSEFRITTQSAQFPNPSIAFDGSNYLVVFQRSGLIHGARVSPLGQGLDAPDGFPISSGTPFGVTSWSPDVAFDGHNYFVVWQKYTNDNYEIFGATVAPSGQVLSEFPVFTAVGEQVEPSVAFDGANYLVVWRDTRSGYAPGPGTDIIGTRVSPQGTILDPGGIAICTATNVQGEPHLAFDGKNYLVVWMDGREGIPDRFDVFGTRVGTNGVVLDGALSDGGIAINTHPSEQNMHARVCFDGQNFFVVWWRPRTYFSLSGGFGARVSPAGALLDGPPQAEGLRIQAPICNECQVLHPNPQFNGRSVMVSWISSGSSKDVYANVIVSKPRITDLRIGSPGPHDARITFASRLNVPYLVQASSDLIEWQQVGGTIIGTGEPIQLTLNEAAQTGYRFLRLQVVY